MSTKRYIIRALAVSGIATVAMLALNVNKASAWIPLIPDPGPWEIPADIRNALHNADAGSQSPAFHHWISPQGAPGTRTLTISEGATYADLDFWWTGIVGFSPSSTTASSMRIDIANGSPPGAVTGLAGGYANLTFAPGQNTPGTFRRDRIPFRYAPSGGFNTTGTYYVEVYGRAINQFAAGFQRCIADGSPVSGWNYDGCPLSGTVIPIWVEVIPRPRDFGRCAVSADNIVKEPGELYQLNFSAWNDSTNGGFAWPVNNGTPQRYRLDMLPGSTPFPGRGDEDISGGQVVNTPFGPILYTGRRADWQALGNAPAAPGVYVMNYHIYGNNALDGNHYVSGANCSITITVASKPYHRVFGGDVIAGTGTATPCADPRSQIIGWNGPTFRAVALGVGSGGQLGVTALGRITDFASNQIWNNRTTGPGDLQYYNGLTFANSGAAPANTAYGGGLNPANAPCPADFWEDGADRAISGSNLTPGDGSATGEVYRYSSNLTLGAPSNGDLQPGERVTIYVDGDVRITDNITFQDTTYNNVEEIPSFRLIARGNIFIDPGVSELNGLFVAIPTNANNGKVFTCSNGFAPPTQGQLEAACRNRLTIYGAVIADLVKFNRTYGTLYGAEPADRISTTEAAERFIYTPEFWLNSDFNPGGNAEAIENLPPVL